MVVVYTVLLVIHVLCAMFWLGGAIYERIYVVGGLGRNRGTEREIELMRILLSTESVFLPVTLTLLLTGVIMTLQAGAGFYDMTWLGLKQLLMTGILFLFALYIAPRMKRLKGGFQEVLAGRKAITEEDRTRLHRMLTGFDLVHTAVLVNAVLAVWKPV